MRITIVIILLLSIRTLNGQTLGDFGEIPERIGSEGISTSALLKQLNWESIVNYCNKHEGFYSYKREKGLLTEFEYVKQGRIESFEIVSYKGRVLEYYFDVPVENRKNEYFFDKSLWLTYIKEIIPDLPESLLLTVNEPTEVLKGFYWLLGVDSFDEYGWICEYSTVGSPPKKRKGLLKLVQSRRVDLLRKLTNHTNPQIKLYAIDALIFLDKDLKILTSNDWQLIYEFRDSGTEIITCGNMGSYKNYNTPIEELLSKQAIKQLTKNYQVFEKLGYLEKLN